MVFKYQLISCSQGSDLLQLTVNHLSGIERMSDKAPVVLPIQLLIQRLLSLFSSAPISVLVFARRTLLNYLLGVRTRVSVLLRLQLQSPVRGTVCLSPNGRVACHCQLPGHVTHFHPDGKIRDSGRFDCVGVYELDETPIRLGENM